MSGEGEGHGGVDAGGEVGFCERYGGEAALGWEGKGDVEVGGWEWEWDGGEGEGKACSVRRGKRCAVRTALGGYIVFVPMGRAGLALRTHGGH